jgi:hypothetical protein
MPSPQHLFQAEISLTQNPIADVFDVPDPVLNNVDDMDVDVHPQPPRSPHRSPARVVAGAQHAGG